MNFHSTYLGFRADALHPRLYAAARIRGLRTRQNVGNDKVSNLPHTPLVGRLETCPTLFLRSRSCRIERHPEKMKINHEETKSTKVFSALASFPSFLRG